MTFGPFFTVSLWALILITNALIAEVLPRRVSWAHPGQALLWFVAILIGLSLTYTNERVEVLFISDISVFSVHAELVCCATERLSILGYQALFFIEIFAFRTSVHAEILRALFSGSNWDKATVLAAIRRWIFFMTENGDVSLLVNVTVIHIGLESRWVP